MTDRELLELAAKAVGKDIDSDRYDEEWGFAIRHMAKFWNPLLDDGDALRLAVSLKIDTLHRSEVWATLAGKGLQLSETYNEDPNSATRRAIVRAAAEIGRAMK